MNCPLCKHETEVIDSRPSTNNTIRRRRRCPQCQHRFTTIEKMGKPVTDHQTRREARKILTGAIRELERRLARL